MVKLYENMIEMTNKGDIHVSRALQNAMIWLKEDEEHHGFLDWSPFIAMG
jgi:hypothetical protein